MIEFDWSQLTPTQFEDLCCDILHEEKYVNPKRISGTGSGDKKRDLIAEEIIKLKVGLSFSVKYLIQCKNYFGSKTSLSSTFVEECVRRAETLHYDIVLIITSWDLSSPAKEIAETITNDKNRKVKVHYWTGSDLVSKLIKYPHLSEKYFSGILDGTNKIIIKGYVDAGGQIFVPGALFYKDEMKFAGLNFLIDTGSAMTTIWAGELHRLGIDVSELEPLRFMSALGKHVGYILPDVELVFNTSENNSVRIKLDSVATFPDEAPIKGLNLLGMDVLKNATLTNTGEIIFREEAVKGVFTVNHPKK